MCASVSDRAVKMGGGKRELEGGLTPCNGMLGDNTRFGTFSLLRRRECLTLYGEILFCKAEQAVLTQHRERK
jgi:hypothetical protein